MIITIDQSDIIGDPVSAYKVELAYGGTDFEGNSTVNPMDIVGDMDPEMQRYHIRIARMFHQWRGITSQHSELLWEADIKDRSYGTQAFLSALRLPLKHKEFRDALDGMMLLEIFSISGLMHGDLEVETALDIIKETSARPPRSYISAGKRIESLMSREVHHYNKIKDSLVFSRTRQFVLDILVESFERDKRSWTTICELTTSTVAQHWMTGYLVSELTKIHPDNESLLDLLKEVHQLDKAPTWAAWRNYLQDEVVRDMPPAWWVNLG